MATTKCNGADMDKLCEVLAKAESMLVNSCGEAGDGFRSMNDELQDNYLWAVSDFVSEARKITSAMIEERWQPTKPLSAAA